MKIRFTEENVKNIDKIIADFEMESPYYWNEERYLIMSVNTAHEFLHKILDIYGSKEIVFLVNNVIKFRNHWIVANNCVEDGIIDIR